MLRQGQELCVLDDLILDVSSFQNYHPGGRFVVNHNVGRDISKYFHGGYSLENLGRAKCKSYLHSTEAIRVAN